MQVYGLVSQTEEGIWPEAQPRCESICLINENVREGVKTFYRQYSIKN